MEYNIKKDILQKLSWLRLNYNELKELHSLLECYEDCNPESMPGITGDKVRTLSPILRKVSDKLIEAKEIQIKLNKTLKEHFGETWESISGDIGTGFFEVNSYRANLQIILELTIDETLTLKYYVDLFRNEYISFKRLNPHTGVKKIINDVDYMISEALMIRLPEMIVFDKY